MSRALPEFEARLRGFDRIQVTEYISRIHGELESLQDQVHVLERNASYAETDRERLNTEIDQLRSDIQRLSGPIDSVEGMSDRIARMMRVASDEARRTKAMAHDEAEALTRELRGELDKASQDRTIASAALAELQASTANRREQILSEAKAQADELLQAAHDERARLVEGIEEAERRRREAQLHLAEEDERRRREAQSRVEEQIKSRWEQAEIQIAALEKEARLTVANMVAAAERDTQAIKERTEAEVTELLKTRGDVLAALSEIHTRIESAIRRDRITVVKASAMKDEA
jgi:chromosome segregation ATPase